MAVSNVELRVDSRQAIRSLQDVNRASKGTEDAFDSLARKAAGLGAALVGGFAIDRVIRDVTELDRNLRRLGTVGVNVGKISPALSKLSAELGGVANKADLAAASYQAASAGFSDTAGNINILRAATKAATGGLADTEAVTEVLVKTLNSYGMSGNRALEVTDSISKAVELGNQEWSDYTSQLGRVASIAALAGVSLDEVNTFIAAATKNGATAEIAFTGLGATLNTLLQPTKESQQAAAELGIAWNYGGLQAKGFSGLMAELAVAMNKDKEATARLLGSQEAMRGAMAAASKDGADFKNILAQIGDATGKTDADFQIMKGSIENTLKALDTSFKNLSEALGKAFGPTVVLVIQDITKGVNGFADVMNAVPQPVLEATGQIVKLIIQFALLKKTLEAVIALRTGFVAAMAAMGTTTAATGAAATSGASAFALYTKNTQTLATAAAGATTRLTALRGILGNIAAMGIITVAVNIIVSGLQETLAAQAELNRLRGNKAAGGAAATFAGATAQTVTGAQQTARQTIAATQAERQRLNAPGSRILQQLNIGGVLSPFGVKSVVSASERRQVLTARERNAQAVMGLSVAGRPNGAVVSDGGGGGTTGGGGGGGDKKGKDKAAKEAERAAEAAKKEAERVAEVIRNRLAEGQLTRIKSELQDKIATAENSGDKMLAARLQGQQKEIDLQYRYAQLLAEEKDIRAQEAIIFEGLSALTATRHETERELNAILNQNAKDQITALEALIGKQYELTEQQKQQKTLAEEITNTVGQGMTSAFDALIQGSEDFSTSLRKIASGVLIDIANQLLQVFVIQKAISAIGGLLGGGITGGGGFSYSGVSGSALSTSMISGNFTPVPFSTAGMGLRANGGSVTAGKPYMVGERGPELFMPGRSGGIAPANSFGGGVNVVVNVDATGSNVQGDQSQAKQLGGVISAAVQAELVKQKRPGGLLA